MQFSPAYSVLAYGFKNDISNIVLLFLFISIFITVNTISKMQLQLQTCVSGSTADSPALRTRMTQIGLVRGDVRARARDGTLIPQNGMEDVLVGGFRPGYSNRFVVSSIVFVNKIYTNKLSLKQHFRYICLSYN